MLRAAQKFRVEFNGDISPSGPLFPRAVFEFRLDESKRTQDGGFEITLVIDANSCAFYTSNAPTPAGPKMLTSHRKGTLNRVQKYSTALDTSADEVPQASISSGNVQQTGTKRAQGEDKTEEPSALRRRLG